MLEEGEQASVREYDSLSTEEKVQAILGAVAEPVQKELAFELGRIDYQSLDEEQKQRVDSVFKSEDVEVIAGDTSEKYILSSRGREKLEKSVDMNSAEHVITSVLWEDHFGTPLEADSLDE